MIPGGLCNNVNGLRQPCEFLTNHPKVSLSNTRTEQRNLSLFSSSRDSQTMVKTIVMAVVALVVAITKNVYVPSRHMNRGTEVYTYFSQASNTKIMYTMKICIQRNTSISDIIFITKRSSKNRIIMNHTKRENVIFRKVFIYLLTQQSNIKCIIIRCIV